MTITPELAEVVMIILKNIRVCLEDGGIQVNAEKAAITQEELKSVLDVAITDFAMQGLASLIAEAPVEEAKPMPDNVVIFPSTPIEA
jgi:hypothetical protein